jgi:predicted ATPase
VRSKGTALPWADRAAYTELTLQRSIESFEEHRPPSGPQFADRGIPDTLAYARLIGLENTRAIEDACHHYRYASVVFLAPPWREIYRMDGERKQDFAEGERTYRVLSEVYEEFGYRSIELPKLGPIARARFVAEHIQPAPPPRERR